MKPSGEPGKEQRKSTGAKNGKDASEEREKRRKRHALKGKTTEKKGGKILPPGPEPILLLGDITGKGRVGVRMLTAQLEALGHEVLALPTALISNIFSLGSHRMLETTGYLLDTLDMWAQMGIGYGMLYVGYITGSAQASALCGAMEQARARSVRVIVDPILGDGGKMYRSVSEDQLEGMRQLCRRAEIITPNMTEACLLSGLPCAPVLSRDALLAATRSLAAPGSSVLITGSALEDGTHAVVGVDGATGEALFLPYEAVEGEHYGTGDRFTALLIDGLAHGQDISSAARAAADGVRSMILARMHEKG